MLGRNHVIANVSTLVIGYGLYINMKDKLPDVLLNNDVVNYFSYNGSSFTDMGIYILLSSILFLFGTLLPDIDEPKSMLGRRFHLPVKHRGLTHTVWFLLLLCGLLKWPIFIWLVLGSFLHIFWDSYSRMGVCWLYPFSKYKEYNNGARVKKGKHFWLYRTGQPSEYVVITLLVVFAVVSAGFMLYTSLKK